MRVSPRTAAALFCAMVACAVLLLARPALAVGGEGEAWPTFTESSACGAQRVITPHNDHQGWMGKQDLLRGPFAAMFGRSVGDVFDNLVRWQIPGSTETLSIHQRIVPALDDAAASIERAFAAGERYTIRNKTTYSTAARTIAGNWRISRHAFGIAFDINAHANPYRGDNKLITDMPDWWSGAFLDAGFCWGGLWVGTKDTMHFAWQGPAFSGYEALPEPYEPLTDAAPFVLPDAVITVVPAAPTGTLATMLADADTNAALDVVRVARTETGVVVDASVASRRHNACSSRQSLVDGLGSIPARAHTIGFADWDGLGGQDLWFATDDDGNLRLTVRWAYGDYAAETAARTSVPTPSRDAWVSTADFDVDGDVDLYVVEGSELAVWSVDPDSGASELLATATLPFRSVGTLFLGDADGDLRPDVWNIAAGTVSVAMASDGYATVADAQQPLGLPGAIVDAAAADYDGDGRTDLIVFDGIRKSVWLGNTRLPDGQPLDVWFAYAEDECEERDAVRAVQDLVFSSHGWVAEGSYEWRSEHDFAAGCDPEDDDCVPPIVTARSLAEFFAWIDGLDPAPGGDALAAPRAVIHAGYELPCIATDGACWDRPLLRTEVAYYFGRFLTDRRSVDLAPHRWVLPTPSPRAVGPAPPS